MTSMSKFLQDNSCGKNSLKLMKYSQSYDVVCQLAFLGHKGLNNNNLFPLQVDAVYENSELASIYQGCEVQGFRYRRIRNDCLYLPQCLLFAIGFMYTRVF